MSERYFMRLHQETPTRLWINNPTLAEADVAIAAGAISCTTNPAYSARIIKLEPERAARAINAAIRESSDDQRAADIAQQLIVKDIMQKFLPLYNQAPRQQGLVSIQGNPHLDEDPAHIVDEAFRFRKISPNFITKIPCTAAGLKAFEQLIPEDMPIIATEVFAMAQAREASPDKALPTRPRAPVNEPRFPRREASVPLRSVTWDAGGTVTVTG